MTASHRHAAIAIGPTARIAVVADTHGHPHPEAIPRLAAMKPAAILHGGDIGDLGVLDRLAAVAPVFAVRGNIDAKVRDVPDTLTIDVGGRLRLLLTHIAVYGPRLRREVAALATAEGAGLVVCGHSHVPFIGRDKGIPVFNPGSIGPRRFSLPIVFGTIEIGAEIRLVHWNCETGEPWAPPA
jgi:putative phosphoesterase